jgi:hypothetical protein
MGVGQNIFHLLYGGKKVNNKTYTFYDIIGVKDELKQSGQVRIVREFEKHAQLWAFHQYEICKIGPSNLLNDQRISRNPMAFLRVLSDSAFLYLDDEYELKTHFEYSVNFKNFLEEKGGLKVFCIFNRDIEANSDGESFVGGTLGKGNEPTYLRLGGVGPAWSNIIESLEPLRKQNKNVWKGKYTMYCLNSKNIVPPYVSKAYFTFVGIDENGHDKSIELHAIEK